MGTQPDSVVQTRRYDKQALDLHRSYHGKIEMVPKVPIIGQDAFSIWYTPGVAQPCLAIRDDPALSFSLTNRGNSVAILTNGSRVLGLGDIGPAAAMPVMEGKALLFKYLGGVDAIPLCVEAHDAEDVIRAAHLIAPSFGGINLEDIRQPDCFHVLSRLRHELDIPVFHDDQQGTATVTLAALLGALGVVGKRLDGIVIAVVGAGAAGIATTRLLIAAGADSGRIYMCDTKGLLHRGRTDLIGAYPDKWMMCRATNAEDRHGGIPEAMRNADVVLALAASRPGSIRPEWVRTMNPSAIVFACGNPEPEIWPWDATAAGARVVGTGRSDFPNQVNNSLGFPAIFRGVLDVRARTITDEMCIAAAREIARCAVEIGVSETAVIPPMMAWEVYPRVAAAVGTKAVESGVARLRLGRDELEGVARDRICAARRVVAAAQQARETGDGRVPHG
jgi:malate dehydrogenase (oxaloacetate-decarboxylating)